MPVWTKEQSDAISKENTNIIVSAGAGSGKTAVLSERVIRKLKNNVNIDELLIMTFTKAAASEMKERIRKKIKKDEYLKEQLDLIDAAYITTFDSFALSIVKKYHYLLNVSNNINIIDENIILLKKKEILDEVFNEFYDSQNENFISMINDFCIKDDTEIKKQILTINNKLDMMPSKIDYLNNYIEINFSDDKINKDIEEYVRLIKNKIMELEENINELGNYVDTEYMQKLELTTKELFNSNTYDEIKTNIKFRLPSLPKNSSNEAKNAKENLSKNIKNIVNMCRYENIDYIRKSILSTKKYITAIIQIIINLDKKIRRYKYDNDAYEFNDIALLAIKVVKENESVREELKTKFKEIMIDEYQDTNDLQEEFVSYISNNNVYMVGDIKQSIYRFRNANPYIFKKKYDNYSKNIDGYKIDLNKNFRSRFEVLDNINLIFNLIMDDAIGGADYISTHQMVFGNNTYNEEGNTNQNNNLDVLLYNYDKECEFSKDEIECFIIAEDIINKVENGYLVFDKDELKLRKIKYSDFVILLDRSSKFDLFKKIFEYKKIPLNILKDEKMNNSKDIYVLNNLLRFIIKIKKREYDKDFKYLFISICRSFLFNMNDDEIFTYFLDNNFYVSNPYILANSLVEDIDSSSSNVFLSKILSTFDFYEKLITIGNVEASLIKIENILNVSKNLADLGYTVYDFSDYLNKMIKEDYTMKYSINTDYGDAVKIMTIHKSKGLEYHVCYFANLYNKFNISDLNEKFLYDNNYGIVTPFFDEGIDTTIYKELLKDNYIKEEISEKIRLFYVAVTRAKEKMIMILPNDKDQLITNSTVLPVNIRNKYRSFTDIINSLLYRLSNYIKEIDLNKIDLNKEYDIIKTSNYEDIISKSTSNLVVNEIKIDTSELQSKSFSKKTNNIYTKEEKRNIEFGLKFHEYLENYNYKHSNISDKFIESKIQNFLNQPLLRDINKAKIYREYEFIYEKDLVEYHGIIDLMLEYNDKIDIIDYKLKQIDDENYIKQLKGYCDFIKTKTNKKISLYLYSIMNDTFRKI